ncbi:tRNA pseudouridine(38-40) synthase TruA [Microscilla marina]|uniref:tRNA pseudouridine synthase A n=1 Tax=Microscilla marina ATCC 23134 TaxID=313606 RepID=A1ZTP5_MICM2|nr:tRNA pseudouridine(38-40) synthase TruA [Microscilla marina]EAY26305.1 tRNA pseudouridine synthase A [Microscilla marina ATCC 23134]
MRYFLELAYSGTQYHGWQIQKNAHSVQAEIQNALSVLLRQPTDILGSGRTDAGVHAIQQYAHFDTEQTLDGEVFAKKMNGILPEDISIKRVINVHEEAHTRFDATQRHYMYRINQEKTPFLRGVSYYNFHRFDIDLMNKAAQIMLKHEDFQCFSKVHTDVNHYLCNIQQAYWQKETSYNVNLLVFYIQANRFLRGMVRAITGTMLNVGSGKITLEEFEQIILNKDRKQAGWSVPAQGLFLAKVEYPYI